MRMLKKDARCADVEEEAWTQDTRLLSFLYPASYAEHLASVLAWTFSSQAHSESQSGVNTVDGRWVQWKPVGRPSVNSEIPCCKILCTRPSAVQALLVSVLCITVQQAAEQLEGYRRMTFKPTDWINEWRDISNADASLQVYYMIQMSKWHCIWHAVLT